VNGLHAMTGIAWATPTAPVQAVLSVTGHTWDMSAASVTGIPSLEMSGRHMADEAHMTIAGDRVDQRRSYVHAGSVASLSAMRS